MIWHFGVRPLVAALGDLERSQICIASLSYSPLAAGLTLQRRLMHAPTGQRRHHTDCTKSKGALAANWECQAGSGRQSYVFEIEAAHVLQQHERCLGLLVAVVDVEPVIPIADGNIS